MSAPIEAFQDIHDAIESENTLPEEEVFNLLGVTNSFPFETNIQLLLEAPTHENIINLPREKKLAAIKTCQVVLGKLFLLASGHNEGLQ